MSGITDPIADLLTRIRNAIHAKLRYTDVGFSKLKLAIIEVLKKQGFIEQFLVKQDAKGGKIRIFLRYGSSRKPVIQGLKRVSRPGMRRYVNYKDVPLVLGGMGVAILSTSQGVIHGVEAHKRKVGGEVLCYVW